MRKQNVFLLIGLSLAALPSWAGMAVELTPSLPSPQSLGTPIVWSAQVADSSGGTLWYRFRARPQNGDFSVIRDFGPEKELLWTAAEREGLYSVEVTVRDRDTGETASAIARFEMQPLATDVPVVTALNHPLVFLYSTPACPTGGRMRAEFVDGAGDKSATPWKNCTARYTMNFYLAGLRPLTEYRVRSVLQVGVRTRRSEPIAFASREVPDIFGKYTVTVPAASGDYGVLLQSSLSQMTTATDLAGNLIWFYDGDISSLTRPAGNGRFFGIHQSDGKDTSHQILREFDLAGYTLKETNAARVSEQLAAMGRRPITAFHHEARRLPNGKILALASTEEFFTDVQGPGPVNILGDMILVLDEELDVEWVWDAFDHLDVRRMALAAETCAPVGGGCPAFYNSALANDWLHGNSVQYTSDANLLYSARHQDWLIKIDYDGGGGSGAVIWKLGQDGDFVLASGDSSEWFSHQHDGEFAPDGSLTVFDNGNTRAQTDKTARSRGQALVLDEANRMATVRLNADLGVYAPALGAANLLSNGNYFFTAGLSVPIPVTRFIETDPAGRIVYEMTLPGLTYRSFRLNSLYSTTY